MDSQVVPDGAVGRQPHLLELELLDSGLIGSDGCALDTHRVLLDGLCSIDGDLVVGLVSVRETEVVVFEVDIEVSWIPSVSSRAHSVATRRNIVTYG